MTDQSKAVKLARLLRHLDLREHPLGRIECAREGCRYCHDEVSESFKLETEIIDVLGKEYETSEHFKETCFYIAQRLESPMKKGRPDQTEQEMIRDLEIGRHAEILHREGNNLPESLRLTAEKFFVSESKARDARKDFLDGIQLINDHPELKEYFLDCIRQTKENSIHKND